MDDPRQAPQQDSSDVADKEPSKIGQGLESTEQEVEVTPPETEEQPMETETKPSNIPSAPVETPKWPFILFTVLLVVALGGGWILYQRAQAPSTSPSLVPFPTPAARLASPTPAPAVSEDEQTRMLSTQGTSDEVSAIEADLHTTNLLNLDAEVKDINQEASSL